MAYLNNFNANEVDPNVGFDPVPEGKYIAVITGSEMKPTKNGAGSYLELTFDIIDGKYKGRKVWARLNLENSSAKAVQIARGDLSAICRATGVMQPQDSIELHNLPLCIKVVCKNREDTGEMTNEIKGYEKKEAALSAAAAANTNAPAAQSINNTPPWQR
jgi:hypothetical protein